jgi:predicted hotdog family 3-hydroxylacyl-ACP dehydratase
MPLDRRWIEEHIPHSGKMCLLDEVLAWDADRIRCGSSTHRAMDNPLRAYGRLGGACGVEYAAQAMAIHGALVASAANGASSTGYIAALRGIKLLVERLDDLQCDLVAAAARVTSDKSTALYDFSLSGAGRMLLTGRATIVFDIDLPTRVATS